mmetsp:Transcript_14461/g.45219  ORF Transcript_14461/g.45219 Transcript_14461/m.45219 type:complete len:210 (-) Transcript_14461:623-1252(-)
MRATISEVSASLRAQSTCVPSDVAPRETLFPAEPLQRVPKGTCARGGAAASKSLRSSSRWWLNHSASGSRRAPRLLRGARGCGPSVSAAAAVAAALSSAESGVTERAPSAPSLARGALLEVDSTGGVGPASASAGGRRSPRSRLRTLHAPPPRWRHAFLPPAPVVIAPLHSRVLEASTRSATPSDQPGKVIHTSAPAWRTTMPCHHTLE